MKRGCFRWVLVRGGRGRAFVDWNCIASSKKSCLLMEELRLRAALRGRFSKQEFDERVRTGELTAVRARLEVR